MHRVSTIIIHIRVFVFFKFVTQLLSVKTHMFAHST